jgi:glycosyltransferase involved in cell wall biosynthesis
MTRTLSVALVTVGDPRTLTGGYLYHQRMAELADRYHAHLRFVSFPVRRFPLATMDARRVSIQTVQSDVIVLDSIAAAFVAPLLVWRPPDVPLVAMLHQPPGGIDHGPLRRRLQAALDRVAYRRARRVLVASESLRDQLDQQGFDTRRVLVVPPGRDVAVPTGRAGDLRQGRMAAVLCVANWVERKGIHSLLKAFEGLPNHLATLHLAGDTTVDPPYARRLRAFLQRPALRDRVHVHGAIPRESVAALYEAADVFVLPSFREPYGTVYGEAMAFGLPVVGWRAGNLPYLARNAQEGLIVPPGDIPALAQAIERLATDSELRRQLGDAARTRAAGFPTWEDSAALFFSALREAASLP